jgi:cold shock CspA family protein
MPSGRVKWFDDKSGEGRISHGTREIPVRRADIETPARAPGARVHFDVTREEGVERAVNVELRQGTRVSRHQHHFGDLKGAHHPDEHGHAALTHGHADRDSAIGFEDHPMRVVHAWAEAVARGELEGAIHLYAPDVELHRGPRVATGRRRAEAFLTDADLLGTRRLDAILRGDTGYIVVRWRAESGHHPIHSRLRIAHGQITEQWL